MSTRQRYENEPPLDALRTEELRLRSKWDREKQSERDRALGIVRAPNGEALRPCWSLKEAMAPRAAQ